MDPWDDHWTSTANVNAHTHTHTHTGIIHIHTCTDAIACKRTRAHVPAYMSLACMLARLPSRLPPRMPRSLANLSLHPLLRPHPIELPWPRHAGQTARTELPWHHIQPTIPHPWAGRRAGLLAGRLTGRGPAGCGRLAGMVWLSICDSDGVDYGGRVGMLEIQMVESGVELGEGGRADASIKGARN